MEIQVLMVDFTEHSTASSRFHHYFPNVISVVVQHSAVKLTSDIRLLERSLHTEKRSDPRLPKVPSTVRVFHTRRCSERRLLRGQRWRHWFNLLRSLGSNSVRGSKLTAILFVPLHFPTPEMRQEAVSRHHLRAANKSEGSVHRSVWCTWGGGTCASPGGLLGHSSTAKCLEIHWALWEREVNFGCYKTVRLGVVIAE